MSIENLEARIAARWQALQTLRFEAAYPDISPVDGEYLDLARGTLLRLNQRDHAGRQIEAELLPADPAAYDLIRDIANAMGELHRCPQNHDEACRFCQLYEAAHQFLSQSGVQTL